jgi:hypothetical protein
MIRTVLAAAALVALVAPAYAKRMPAPPAARGLTCKSQMSFNHEAATIELASDGLHVRLAADTKLASWWTLDRPKAKAHKPLRAFTAGGAIDLVIPTNLCKLGGEAGLVSCGAGATPVKVTFTGTGKGGKQLSATLDLASVGLFTSRIDTTTTDGTERSWNVRLTWGATAGEAATAAFTFAAADTCTAH